MDRMRESLFARLGPLSGLRVLDLFSGSGAFALESISRGAISVAAVERDRRTCIATRANLQPFGAVVYCMAVERFIEQQTRRLRRRQHEHAAPLDAPEQPDEPHQPDRPDELHQPTQPSEQSAFDLIFADPPFAYRHRIDLIERLAAIAGGQTRIIIHYPSSDALPLQIGALVRGALYGYGQSQVGIYGVDYAGGSVEQK